MQLVVEAILGELQMGFRLARTTTDVIWVLCNLIEWNITLQWPFFLCFVDLKKAYDNVNRKAL
jgi:hypothetical protein